MAGFLIGLTRTVLILTLIVTVLALLVAGAIAGLAWVSDTPLQIVNSATEQLGFGSVSELRLPALWERFSPYVYACASATVLSVVLLFVLRPKKKAHAPVEGAV